jgi:hypothetical protein
MKSIKLLLLLFIASVLFACPQIENVHESILIVNKSHKNIVYQERINPKDTFFYCSNSGITIRPHILADSSAINKSPIRPSGWEYYLNKGQVMHLLIADKEIYDKYWLEPCDTIHKYVPILHRYQLTLEDLQRMNWTVIYPPTEEMKDMEMEQ